MLATLDGATCNVGDHTHTPHELHEEEAGLCYNICKKMGEILLRSMQCSCNAGATFGQIRLSPIFLHYGATCCIVFSYLAQGQGCWAEQQLSFSSPQFAPVQFAALLGKFIKTSMNE